MGTSAPAEPGRIPTSSNSSFSVQQTLHASTSSQQTITSSAWAPSILVLLWQSASGFIPFSQKAERTSCVSMR
ncbi:MAG: hypothetical protein DUD31_07090 [Coriobacteriaceae bacterium]|nr:hypothetical protein [Atopobiaceae bacterium]RRF92836.1 MAG: hypothetical protein DUD31_07090 [Coriobacteriaceae bacterium]